MAGGFDVANVYQARQSRSPETSQWSAPGVERQVIARALVEPARRHYPCVFIFKIALLRPRYSALIPGMALIDRVAQRIALNERLGLFPVVVVGTAEQN